MEDNRSGGRDTIPHFNSSLAMEEAVEGDFGQELVFFFFERF